MNVRPRTLVLSLALLSAGACARDNAETYGFIATLGNDTTSLERITRTGNRIAGDAIGRSPVVVRRHWEATLAPDGTILQWSMDTHFPNAAPGETHLHHELEMTDSTVRLKRGTSLDTTDVVYQKQYAVTVPWNAFLYGTYELLLQAARGRPDSTHIGQYFFEGWAEGQIGYAQVRALGDGRYAISSTGLAGEGVGQIDDGGRLLSYSGEGTTYLQEVRRVSEVPDIDAVATRFAADEQATGVQRALSARDTARTVIGATTFAVDYSRPRARGRTLVGGVIPLDRVWRTGANAATHLTVSAPATLAGIPLDAGTYTLWTLPTADGVQLIVNRQTGQWGTGYGSQHDIGRAAMQVDTTSSHVEQFTIGFEPGLLVMEWGSFRWTAPLVVRP